MSLISCFECNKRVSDTAKNCPNCGFNIKRMVKKNKLKNKRKVKKKNLWKIVVVFLFGIVAGLIYRNYSINKRYETIKIDVEEEIILYLNKEFPAFCTHYKNRHWVIDSNYLIYQSDMDEEKLLDFDGKSYCKARIEVKCVRKNEMNTDVYIKCKDYEDKKYKELDFYFDPYTNVIIKTEPSSANTLESIVMNPPLNLPLFDFNFNEDRILKKIAGKVTDTNK